MKEVSIVIKTENYKIYDDTNEYLNKVCFSQGAKVRSMEFPLRKKIIDGVTYYVDHTMHDILVTEDVMKEVNSMCKVEYNIHEKDIVPGKQFSCTYSGDYDTVEEVLNRLKREDSWLFKAIEDIDFEIANVENNIREMKESISHLEGVKKLLTNDEYLKSKVSKRYVLFKK